MDQADKLRLLMEKKPPSSRKKEVGNIDIYTIASGKGGVGKTNFVVNLAITLQKRGKRVLIIDADLGMANVDVVLGLYPKNTLYDVLFHDMSLKDIIMTGPEGIKIIPGGSGMMEMATLDVEKQKAIAQEFLVLEDVDTILIDTGAGISKNLLAFITFSQELILVTTPEPTSLTDAYSVIKVLAEYQLKKPIKVILNRCPDKAAGQSTFERLKKTSRIYLNTTLESLGYVLDDLRVVRSVMEQTPFVLQYPQCKASKCINDIANRLVGHNDNRRKIKSIQEVYSRLLKVFG